jgi:hypothetical protein
MVLAGGKIIDIDFERSAFGQTAITDLISQNKWIYFKKEGTGILAFENEIDSSYADDPSLYGNKNSNVYALQLSPNSHIEGFSQVYSPTSSSSFGGYAPVPINVYIYLRDGRGVKSKQPLGITMLLGGYSDMFSDGAKNSIIQKGQVATISIETTQDIPADTSFASDLKRAAADARRAFSSSFDDSAIFKFGSAKFKTKKVTGSSTDEGEMIIDLVCIEAGHSSSTPYNFDEKNDYRNIFDNDQDYIASRKVFNNLMAIDGRSDITTVDQLIKSGELYEVKWVQVQQANIGKGGLYYLYVPRLQTSKIRNITTEEMNALKTYKNYLENINYDSGDKFYTKVIAKYEEASYTTLTSADIVYLSIRCQVFRRISGRQRVYGSNQAQGYPESDNGIKQRTAIFTLRYRKTNASNWSYAPGFYAVRRAAEQDNFIYIKFRGNEKTNWQFKLEPVIDPLSEIKTHPEIQTIDETGEKNVIYHYLQNSLAKGEQEQVIDLGDNQYLYFIGFSKESLKGLNYPFPPLDQSPGGTNEWDWFNLDADTDLVTSFDRGPEFSLSAVTEQQIQEFDEEKLYKNLSMIGFNIFSGRNLQDMRSFSTHVTEGKPVRLIDINANTISNQATVSTSYAPDIFLDTIYDSDDGIGKYAEIDAIDTARLIEAKRFCVKNNLFMDCLIADLSNWREFWASVAPYSLLEFARINGRETLIPSVPFNPLTGEITQDIAISALFNQGNILEDTYKEEFMDYDANVQDIIATAIYRSSETNNVFSVNRSVTVKLEDAIEEDCIRETFDLSAYVTNEDQAIKFLKLICNLRRHVRSAIEFRTFPTVSPVAPGGYIYFDAGFNAWQQVRTGIVEANGKLNLPLDNTIPEGQAFTALLYKSDRGVVTLNNVYVTNNQSPELASYEGYLFVLGEAVASKRVYRVSDIEMDEEGEVTIRATIFPCDSSGKALISDFGDHLFEVTR